MNHYQKTLALFAEVESKALEFGYSAIRDLENGITIRQMSIDLCGNNGLEDRIGRYIQAARWDALIKQENGQLYEDARTWLSPSHFTVLYRYGQEADYEAARDVMEQCFVRNVTDKRVTEVKPVEWLRGRVTDPAKPSTETLRHRLWKTAAKLLGDMQGQLAKLGNDANKRDRRIVRILGLIVRELTE